MKSYGIFPAFDFSTPDDERVQACISMVTKIVCDALRDGGDNFYYTIDWRDPGTPGWGICTEDLAEPHIVELNSLTKLTEHVRLSVDPYSGKSVGVIRSIATCRAVTFGYDGQAFLCLRHEDEAPLSRDTSLVVVEDKPWYLTETDYFDGVIVSKIRPGNSD